MFVIVFGTRQRHKTLGEGQFHCPNCGDQHADYWHKQVREWYTIYYIPAWPISKPFRYVECKGCGATYGEIVLEMEPPANRGRLALRIMDVLESGASLRTCAEQLVELGIPPELARWYVAEVAGKDVWKCKECGSRYLREVRTCEECEDDEE